MSKMFDFVSLNTQMIKNQINSNDVLIAVQDASFISKSGKKTHGLGYFWNGCKAKTEKGLELDLISIVRVNKKKEAYSLSAEQTPSISTSKPKRKKRDSSDLTKIDFYLSHIKKVVQSFIDLGVSHVVADAFYAKIKYVDGITNMGFSVISKLRKDARLCRPYTGPQKARGRKKKFEIGNISSDDFEKVENLKIDGENIELKSAIVYSVSLKRYIKIVWTRKTFNNKKYGETFLFSTDLSLSGLQIYTYYTSRFQIEFIFRDTKGFTGLNDCQSRNKKRLHYHFNASLMALNVAKFQDIKLQKAQQANHAFSMTNWA